MENNCAAKSKFGEIYADSKEQFIALNLNKFYWSQIGPIFQKIIEV